MDENPTIKKVFSITLAIFTFLLLGFGFTVLGYLGFQVYKTQGLAGFALKNPPTKISDISRTISVPSPSSADTSFSLVQSSSSPSAQPLTYDQIKFLIQTNTKKYFSDPQYSQIISVVDQATNATDPSNTYQNYKQAFDLMKTAYIQTKNPYFRTLMNEISLYSSKLPEFKKEDMELPS